MTISTNFKEIKINVGDRISVSQKVKEGEKSRTQVFEGILIAIKNRESGKSITVRRVGEQNVGIERVFPLKSPTIESILVKKTGSKGARRAKLYYLRKSSKTKQDKIYKRSLRKTNSKPS